VGLRIGQDNPGTRGQFAQYTLGSTPKYAINEGFREDFFQNTLSRLYMAVPATEWPLFERSIASRETLQLARRIAGRIQERTVRDSPNGPTRKVSTLEGSGYIDFFIQQAGMGFQEDVDIKKTLADNFVVYTFGEQPKVWQYSGWLMNTVQDDQATSFMRAYMDLFRATQLARRQKTVSLKIDSYIITGAIIALNMSLQANPEIVVPFSFQLLVKRVTILPPDAAWSPLSSAGSFSDVNAVAFDRHVLNDGARRAVTVRLPENTANATPQPDRSADPRTSATPLPTDAVGLASTVPQGFQGLQAGTTSGGVTSTNPANAGTNEPFIGPPLPPDMPVTSPYTQQPETLNRSPSR
jgi:hypothetical protein